MFAFILTSTLLINVFLLTYVYTLKPNKCECSKDIRRTYIQGYLVFAIFTSGFLLALSILQKDKLLKRVLSMTSIPISIASVIYIASSLQYAMLLRNKNCTCTNNIVFYALHFMSPILSVSSILLIILITGGFGFIYKRFSAS